MKRSVNALLFALLASVALSTQAQVAPSAYARGTSITAGGEASIFQPDYAGFGVPQASVNRLYGIGTYVDVKFTPWVQIEGEGRWLRFNQSEGIYEDNYFIGPRLPIYKLRYKRITPYGKLLIGLGRLNFEDNNGWGRYTALAYGGGLDIKLTSRINVRVPDVEYQQWLKWTEGGKKTYNLFPYGASVGVSYRIFGSR